MHSAAFTVVFVAVLRLTNGLSAQGMESLDFVAQPATDPPRNQLSLDAGHTLAFSLSYVRRVGDMDFSVGGGLGFAWELNSHSFEGTVWEVMHVEGFVRYQPISLLQLDLGATWMRHIWADDCSECTGTFAGLHSSAMVGYRFVYLGVGSEFGVIWSPQIRVTIPWG